MIQGKCDKCKIAWWFGRDVRRVKALCPRCFEQLQSTSCQMKKYEWRDADTDQPINREEVM